MQKLSAVFSFGRFVLSAEGSNYGSDRRKWCGQIHHHEADSGNDLAGQWKYFRSLGIAGCSAKDREDIGVVFDELPFAQTLFVSHLGRIMKGIYQNWDQKQYEEYLQKFALPDRKELKDFSRGMKMKLSLAVALSHNAKLLILDEPTSGLDR